jgi:retron-type reverse transcriptase
MKVYKDLFNQIISPQNLFLAWDQFKKGKGKKKDVRLFEWNLEENIFKLHRDLKNKVYQHGAYYSFNISDPKPRNIHKSSPRDRVLHHAIFQVLYPIFEAGFINSSFSCREEYGTHRGVRFLQETLRKATRNNRIQCFALKCDIKKFFDTVDHNILLSILKKKIKDTDTIWLLEKIIFSFQSEYSVLGNRKGVPIGNLTSQLFANVYMNEFDQFVKQELKVKYYMRYTDDFLVISESREYLENLIPRIIQFLGEKLSLRIHEEKTRIRKTHQGIDFLGYVAFNKYRLARTKTRKRMIRKLEMRIKQYKSGDLTKDSLFQSLNSYIGFLSHAETHVLQEYFKEKVIDSLM